MPSTPNTNKFTIVSNDASYTTPYYSDGGSGINLHSPISMEVSIQRVSTTPYTVVENDFTILCDAGGLGSNMDIDLGPLSNTGNNGKMLAIKKLPDGNTFQINITNATIDGSGAYFLMQDYESIIIIYDKIANEWYKIGNV